MKPNLVILSTNFGSNFSGGCSVTHEIVNRLQDEFSEIIFVGSRVGNHEISNLTFIKSRSWLNTLFVLSKFNKGNHVFYGDFYNAILFVLAGVRYVFTYHDNWPELSELDIKHKIQNIYYSGVYRYIFNHAVRLVTVSVYKKRIIEKMTDTPIEVIPNGFSQKDIPTGSGKREGILMVGNIDRRKYGLAVSLFNALEEREELKIDIYGHFVDTKMVEKLKEFSFVNLKGFQYKVPYHSYKFLLHTSFVESFGMVFLEAISNGLPVVTFDRGGAKEIVGKENGILIAPYRIDKMKEALYDLLERNMKADPESVNKYSWDRAKDQYLEIFKISIG